MGGQAGERLVVAGAVAAYRPEFSAQCAQPVKVLWAWWGEF